jgi:hypothetical protein
LMWTPWQSRYQMIRLQLSVPRPWSNMDRLEGCTAWTSLPEQVCLLS